jgi:CheY-like chemotaxis protein
MINAGTHSYRVMPQNLRPRVLLVDDNADILETLHFLLKPSCEVVGLITDSVEVLESVMTLKPDVIVLDVSMPGINGFDICRQIKHETPETRIVFLTAFEDESFKNLALSVGASALVAKSSVDELLVAIHGA